MPSRHWQNMLRLMTDAECAALAPLVLERIIAALEDDESPLDDEDIMPTLAKARAFLAAYALYAQAERNAQ